MILPRCVNILVNVLNIFAFQSVASSDGQKLTHLEVMYLTTSAGSSTCGAGKWLVQRASDDDYVDAQLGYFELKGQTCCMTCCERCCWDYFGIIFIYCIGMIQAKVLQKKDPKIPLRTCTDVFCR